mmetsp:Transcript_25623/g.24531  ORF Transcript_25623/g.24531 Transcript_25623/m.24531 type:complete len:92 (-) Transcript_25623:19-294(-)
MTSSGISLPMEADVEVEIKSLEEHLTLNQPLPSVKGFSTNFKQYEAYKIERDKALVLRLLDSNSLDGMGTNGLMEASVQEAQIDVSFLEQL